MNTRPALALGIVLALVALFVALLVARVPDADGVVGSANDVAPRGGVAEPQLAASGDGPFDSTARIAVDEAIVRDARSARLWTVSRRGGADPLDEVGELVLDDGDGTRRTVGVRRGFVERAAIDGARIVEFRGTETRHVPLEPTERERALAAHTEIETGDLVFHGTSDVLVRIVDVETMAPIDVVPTFVALRRGAPFAASFDAEHVGRRPSSWIVEYAPAVEGLRIEAPGYLPKDIVLPDPRAPDRELDVTLQPSGTVRFEIVAHDSGAAYRVEVEGPSLPVKRLIELPAGSGSTRDAQLRPGPFLATLWRAGPVDPACCDRRTFVIERGPGVTVVALDARGVDLEPEKGAIHLVVRHGDADREALPVERVGYAAWRERSRVTEGPFQTISPHRLVPSSFTRRAIPEAPGTSEWECTIPNLEPGIYTLDSSQGAHMVRVAVEPGATAEALLDIGRPSAHLEIEVVDAATGVRLVPMHVVWLRVNEHGGSLGPSGSCSRDDLGEVSTLHTESGRVAVTAFVLPSRDRLVQPRATVELAPGEHRRLRLEADDASTTTRITVEVASDGGALAARDLTLTEWGRRALARLDDGRLMSATTSGTTHRGSREALWIGFAGDVVVEEFLLPPHPSLGPLRAVRLEEPGPLGVLWRFEPD